MVKVEPTVSNTERILFIGFGKFDGYASFNWSDDHWLNAADYHIVYINCLTLDKLLLNLQKNVSQDALLSEEPSSAATMLDKKLRRLRQELLKMTFTGRAVFALLTRPQSLNKTHFSISNYDWSPYKIKIAEHYGEIAVVHETEFEEYTRFLTHWDFSIQVEPEGANHWGSYSDVIIPKTPANARFVAANRITIGNLSNEALGLAVWCNVVGVHANLIKQTTPMFLLHYPPTGNTQEILNSLLALTTSQRLQTNDVPDWVSTFSPPAVGAIDAELKSLHIQQQEIDARIEVLSRDRKNFERWRSLLYATDTELEGIVLEALQLLGIDNASPGPKSQWDISFALKSLNIVVEVKGLTKGLGRKHVFDLDRHVAEYKTTTFNNGAKGLLIFNPFRLEEPAERKNRDCVAGDAIKFAKDLNISLVSTITIYEMVREVLEGIENNCTQELEQLCSTKGLYKKPL